MAMTRAVLAVLALAAAATTASAQAPSATPTSATPSDALRDGNEAAAQGDWPRVSALVDPLLDHQLPPAELAEAHRLAGIAAYFQQRADAAERHFLAYLRIELDARLDPALYPPEVVNFFNDVRVRHQAELRARDKARRPAKRYWILNLLPPVGQVQNGQRTKAYVFGGLIGAFAVGNVTSYLVLRSWCTRVSGSGGASATCDERESGAARLRAVNIATGVGLILTYSFGVYDGISNYRRREVQPFVMPASGGGVVGVTGAF